MGGARTTYYRTEYNEYTADNGGCGKLDHPRADSRAKHIGSIVRTQ
jgi:hypothetical protein